MGWNWDDLMGDWGWGSYGGVAWPVSACVRGCAEGLIVGSTFGREYMVDDWNSARASVVPGVGACLGGYRW